MSAKTWKNILLNLLKTADMDPERTERGIIYIDAIDKIEQKSDNPSILKQLKACVIVLLRGRISPLPPSAGQSHQGITRSVDTKTLG